MFSKMLLYNLRHDLTFSIYQRTSSTWSRDSRLDLVLQSLFDFPDVGAVGLIEIDSDLDDTCALR